MYTDYVEEDENQENNENFDNSYYEESGNSGDNKEKIKKIAFLALLFCIVLILIVVIAKGCSGKNDDNNGGNSNINNDVVIALNRTSIALKVGEEFNMVAQVLNADVSNPIVIWNSEDTNIVTVNDDGNIMAISEGTTRIIASYKDNDNISYSSECEVTVTNNVKKIESIKIQQDNFTLKKGEEIVLQIEVTPKDAEVENLIFSSDNTSVATVSESGTVNAIGVGTTTITVKTQDEELSDSVTVTVIEDGTTIIRPTDLVIRGLSQDVYVGGSAEILTDIIPSNATNQTLIWTSSNTSIATVNNGIVTGKKAGTCKIIVSTSNNISREISITVHSKQVNVTGIEVTNGTSVQMTVGGTRKILYSITPSNATNKDVTFSSSNPQVAMVISSGIVAAVGEGNAVITVKTKDGNKIAIVNIVVKSNGTSTGNPSNPSNPSDSGDNDGSSGDSSGNNPSSCTPYGMITVANNCKEYGTVVSSNSFSSAKPYTNKSIAPQIEVTNLDSCASSFKYAIYYGLTENSIGSSSVSSGSLTKVGSKISLSKGDGYYKIVITANSNGAELKKYYYAIVKRGDSATKPIITLTKNSFNRTLGTASITFNASSLYFNIKEIKYCSTNLISCSITSTSQKITPPVSTKNYKPVMTVRNLKAGYHVCAIAYDVNGNASTRQCIEIK